PAFRGEAADIEVAAPRRLEQVGMARVQTQIAAMAEDELPLAHDGVYHEGLGPADGRDMALLGKAGEHLRRGVELAPLLADEVQHRRFPARPAAEQKYADDLARVLDHAAMERPEALVQRHHATGPAEMR